MAESYYLGTIELHNGLALYSKIDTISKGTCKLYSSEDVLKTVLVVVNCIAISAEPKKKAKPNQNKNQTKTTITKRIVVSDLVAEKILTCKC